MTEKSSFDRFASGLGRVPWGRRGLLWALLVVLVFAMLATLVWLAGRYETSQVQAKVERDAVDAIVDIRTMLTRNLQNFQALQSESGNASHGQGAQGWSVLAAALLREHRELLRIEWRGTDVQVQRFVDTPFRAEVFGRLGRVSVQSDVVQACANARRLVGPAYSTTYFLPQEAGAGLEVMDLCMPLMTGAYVSGYLVASYSLPAILSDTVGPQLTRGQEVSFTEVDGTRLALHGALRRGNRIFTAQQVLNLPGNTVLLRLDSWRAGPDLFPNVLTAVVTVLSIALLSVLALLGKDLRRRVQAERNLADALAFRKAMEDSLVTGLVARDTHGHIRYVNPAFCQMVGYGAETLLTLAPPAPQDLASPARLRPPAAPSVPFWPPEAVQAYREKLLARGGATEPVREGLETVFVHQNGTRFPVLIFEAPLINALGEQTGWMSAFVDVSEQRRIEAISRASQERLQATARLATVGEMASLMSHELNQPLAAISSYATGSLNVLSELLGDTRVGTAQAVGDGANEAHVRHAVMTDLQRALQRIAEQADRAGKVIRSVHNFVRRRDGEHEAVSPQSLLEAIMPLVSLQAYKLGVQVHTVVGEDLPLLVCDRTMLEQVLLNLARNGMQAMDVVGVADTADVDMHPFPARVLTLEVQHAPAWGGVAFSVADVGVGIAPAVVEKLFTPFFTTKVEGMGLGLSLCRTVVEQHGGKLEFENLLPQGTIFTFTLPVRRDPR